MTRCPGIHEYSQYKNIGFQLRKKKKKTSEILGHCSKTKALKMQKHGVLEVSTLELVANLKIKEIMLSIEYITQIKLDI